MYEYCCRICLANGQQSKLSSLYMKKQIESYAEMVEFCTGIEISYLDTLPQQICDECLIKVTSACEFKQKCIKTDDFLRKLFQKEEIIIKDEPTEGILDGDICLEDCLDINIKEEVKFIDTAVYIEPVVGELHNEKSVNTKTKTKKKRKEIEEYDDQLVVIQYAQHITPIEDAFKCNFCEKIVKHRSTLRKHVKRHLNNKSKRQALANFQCFICNRMFQSIHMKHDHIEKYHSKERKCSVCSKTSASAMGLENHCMSHTQELKHMCHLCGMTFLRGFKLEAHVRAKHGNTAKSYICDLCGMMTKQKPNLDRHMRTVHKKIKEFKCDRCTDEREFTTRTALNHHLYRFHDLEAPVKCPDCGIGFAVEAFLKAHKKNRLCRMAPGKRPREKNRVDSEVVENGFRCRVCFLVFDTKAKISMHNFSKHKHSNKCDVCGLQLANYASLQKHKKTIHEKIKPYKCEFCEKLFSDRTAMETHRNTHTGDKPFSCKFCAFNSGDRSTIYKHQKKMHPDPV